MVVFWWWQHWSVPASHACSPGPSWARDGSGARREDWAVEYFLRTITSCGSAELREQGTPPKDAMFLMLIVLTLSQIQFFFPHFHSCSLPSSLLVRLSSFFLFLTRRSSVLHQSRVACRLDLLKVLVRSNRNTRPDTTATHARGVTGKMDDRHKWAAPLTSCCSLFLWNTFYNLNAQSRSSPSTHICLYIKILP